MRLLFVINFITIIYAGCSPKNTDVDIKANIESRLKAKAEMSGVTVDVKNGIATIEGQCKDEACRMDCEAIAQKVEGVKTVINDLQLTNPAPAYDSTHVIGAAPVLVIPEDPLISLVNEATEKYPNVKATVADSIVTLTGKITKADLSTLMKELSALNPRKIEQNLTIVKHTKKTNSSSKKTSTKKKKKSAAKKKKHR